MTIRNLEFATAPKSVALIGASEREGSVGRIVLNNIVEGGFEGEIWCVNPKYRQIGDRPCYSNVTDLPGVPDLAVVVTPPKTVPTIIDEAGRKGTKAAVVITAGLTRTNGLRQAMLDAARPHMLRVIGPNTVGLVVPPAKLNASFAHMQVKSGGLALLSQSGAIATSLMDWSADEGIGFSSILSLGDMADVDVGDCLDMLAGDARTRAILLYLETVPNPRKFMSAARSAARIKPVIAIKSGRHAQAAKAAATHTGALSGADKVVDAALHRAGILRVRDLAELFDAAETVARFQPLPRSRVGIVTNGGGAGVLAVDRLVDLSAELTELTPETLSALDAALPENWSHANPVDIIGDASPERYAAAVRAVAADPGTDALMVMNCPTGLASPVDAAHAVAALTEKGTIGGKPVLTCWLGASTAREGRAVLQAGGVASYDTPGHAAVAVSYLSEWSRAGKALTRVPSSRSEDVAHDRDAALAVLRKAAGEGRRMLTEPEAKAVLAAYGVPVPETEIVRTAAQAARVAKHMLKSGGRVVLKVLSKTISHKSDVGGVVLDLETPDSVSEAVVAMKKRLKAAGLKDQVDGFVLQPMVARRHAHELIVGVNRDPIFGPAVLFGAGGTAVEVLEDTAIGLPPLDDVLAGDLIDQTRVGRLLAGYRDREPANREAIVGALNAVSQLVVDFPCLVGMDINPLLADADGVIALDARIEIGPEAVEQPGPNPMLAIRPYPDGWESRVSLAGNRYTLRPIKPSDVSLYPDFLAKVSPDDIRLRFLAPRRSFPDEMLIRLTQLDYEREMAFVALTDEGQLAGIGRLSSDPDQDWAEFGLLVRTDLQGQGLGWALLERLIEYGKVDGLKRIEGFVLRENTRMLAMCREIGFTLKAHPDEPGVTVVTRDLEGQVN